MELLNAGKSLLLGKLRKSPGNEYVLKRDYAGSSRYVLNSVSPHVPSVANFGRLNLSFFLWKDLLRFNLHPDVSEVLSPNAHIADVATGTG
jgi:hypothetical protein